jgi:hypothetical protein
VAYYGTFLGALAVQNLLPGPGSIAAFFGRPAPLTPFTDDGFTVGNLVNNADSTNDGSNNVGTRGPMG